MPDRLTPPDLDLDGPAAILLDAVIAMSSDLDLHAVLGRIVLSAMELTGARYGALGVIGADGRLVDFITRGMDDETEGLIPERPRGRGLLGALIDHPHPLRLTEISHDSRSFGFPAQHPPMHSFLGVPVRIRGTVFGNLYLTEKADGEDFSPNDEVLIETIATAAGYVIENARAYRLSELRRSWLEALTDLSSLLQPPIDYRLAIERLTNAMRSLTRARATVFLTRHSEDPVVALCADVSDQPVIEKTTNALLSQLPQQVNRLTEIEQGDFTCIVVPVPAQLAGRGVVVLFQNPVAPIEHDERELLTSFAEQAALALDRAQAVSDRAELAVVTDRERIARDLHDIVIQRLFASGLQLQGLKNLVTDPDVLERLEGTIDALDVTVKNIRSSIFELKTQSGDSLRAETRNVVREYTGAMGFTPIVRTVGPVDSAVPESVRDHLISVLREAVSNLARHAMATSAEVDLTVTDSELTLTVADDGVGPPSSKDVIESGLRNARRRAADLGGTFELVPREPRGTAFVWTVPLRR